MISRTRTRMVIAQAAVLAVATGFAAMPFAPPASGDVIEDDAPAPSAIERDIGVAQCDPPQTQMCHPAVPDKVFTPNGEMRIEFTAHSDHCSDIIAHVRVDGHEQGSKRLAPGETGDYRINVDPGDHMVSVQAEGVPGGCNVGYLTSWAGHLTISTPDVPVTTTKPAPAP